MLINKRLVAVSMAALALVACSDKDPCDNGQGAIKDEALCVGREASSLRGAGEDYYADMDYGISKKPEELQKRLEPFVPGISKQDAVDAFARGRNNWIVWTAGNDRLWDEMSRISFGNLDLLKTVSNHPALKVDVNGREEHLRRGIRWEYLGLVNEPCYQEATGPREDRFGLWLDSRDTSCAPDPFENEEKYPGVEIGARGSDHLPSGSYYGYGTGIVGLRLFPNPAFDEEAAEKWDAERYYTDPSYYNDQSLVKPYRVGMSCGFCHVGPNPTNPPLDPEEPKWANLNSNPGAQYFWVNRIFMYDPQPSNFVQQLFATSRPGALDTSLISTDYINNPRTMNAVYNLAARVEMATRFGLEKLHGGSDDNKQFNDYPAVVPASSPLNDFYNKPDVLAPHVLKDGADSVGALGALNRVYVNIGLYSEDWLTHFNPLVGGKKITPFTIENARENSSYWNANEAQTMDTALFFLGSATPDNLADTDQAERYLSADEDTLAEGKTVFADTCARCHSSKLPEKSFDFFPNKGCTVPTDSKDYLDCFGDYWRWTQTEEFKAEMRDIVASSDFLDNNYLSTDLRVPVTLLETNACSPLATNGLADNIWDNFSSESYKELPGVGMIKIQHPYTGEVRDYEMPAGGRGYTRVPSLVSLWTSAPFLLNNSLGDFKWYASVDDRMASFDDSITKLLWPEKRDGNFTVVTASGLKHPGHIDRTTETSYLEVDNGFLPEALQKHEGILARLLPWLFSEGGLKIGPIPEGTPVNLLSNVNLGRAAEGGLGDKWEAFKLILKIKKDLKALPANATDEEAKAIFADLLEPLLKESKCADFVVNKGHYFGTRYLNDVNEEPLTDAEKLALVEFLKTL